MLAKAVLSIISFLQLIALGFSQFQCNARFNTSSGIIYFDLSGLTLNSAVGDYYGSDGTNTYVMNVCSTCTIGGPCTQKNSTICQFSGGAYTATLGTLAEPYPEWSLIDVANPGKGVKLYYANGDLCNGTVPVTATVSFFCDPNAPFKGVFSVVKDATQCIYSISLTTPNSCPLPAIIPSLRPGIPSSYSVNQNVLTIWQFPVADNTSAELKASLLQTNPVNVGNLNLFLRYGALPTTSAYDSRDSTYALSHQVVIRLTDQIPLRPGNYYIGVLGLNTATIYYNLTATLYPCPNNCSSHGVCNTATHQCQCDAGYVSDKVDCSAQVVTLAVDQTASGSLFGANTAYYRVAINAPYAFQFFISMIRLAGPALPVLMTKLEYYPTITINDGLVRDTLAPSASWELIISPPTLTNGDWLIAVVGSQDDLFNYTLTAHLYDCPRNCSGHGSCNPATHLCTCDPDWDLTNDCSQDKYTIVPQQPYTVDIPAYETFYFQIPVTASQAAMKFDLVFNTFPFSGRPPTIYILFNKVPTSTEYYLTSPLPIPASNQIFYIPHTDLQAGSWFIAIKSNYNDLQKVQVSYTYEVDCAFCQHGTCHPVNGSCLCDSGWQGYGCDVSTSASTDDSGTSVGVAVALVFVFLFVGIAVGILIKREFPSVCGYKGTNAAAHFDDENELPSAKMTYT